MEILIGKRVGSSILTGKVTDSIIFLPALSCRKSRKGTNVSIYHVYI